MRRMIFLLLLCLGLPFSGARGQDPELAPGSRAVVALERAARANVRSSPEVRSGNIVAKAPLGTLVEVRESTRRGAYRWYRVRALDGSFEGWIRGDLLALSEPPPATPSPPQAMASEESERADVPAGPAPEPRRRRPERDWSKQLERLLPGIDSCLAATTRTPAAVLFGRPLPFDMVEIVLRDASGRVWDCFVDARGGTPLRYDPLGSERNLFSGTPNPVFWRHGAPPALGRCEEKEPVRDPADGTLLGVLVYQVCP